MNRQDYLQGKVIWFNRQRGYGMIAQQNGSADVFFHHSVITGSGPNILFENDIVEFMLDYGRADFPEASEVWRYEPAAPQAAAPSIKPQQQVQAEPQMHSVLGSSRTPSPQLEMPRKASGQPRPVEIRRVQPISEPRQSSGNEHVTGIVLSFNRLKGFGFIEPDDGSDQVYVSFSGLRNDGHQNLFRGDRVRYISVDDGKGPKATDVVVY